MIRGRVWHLILAVALILAVVALALIWQARAAVEVVEGEREEQLVYDVWAYAGDNYSNVFYPQSVDTLHLVAEAENVLNPKLTEVYYWPLSREYKADWTALNRRLTGVLEIVDSGVVVAQIEPVDYALIYDGLRSEAVVFGEAAREAYAGFQRESDQVAEALEQYYEAEIAYERAYQEYLAKVAAGDTDAQPPEPLDPNPPTVSFYVSRPLPGFPVTLPEGDYELRLRTVTGQLVENSSKRLHLFEPRRENVGFSAFVADRWTRPEEALSPEAVIYVEPGEDLYLQPHYTAEFERYNYVKLLEPQQVVAGRTSWEWVRFQELEDVRLQVLRNSEPVDMVELLPFFVEQSNTPALGYTVIPYDPETAHASPPSFTAFYIRAPEEGGFYQLQLVGPGGELAVGSVRELHVLRSAAGEPLYALSAAPIILGGIILVVRRRQTHA